MFFMAATSAAMVCSAAWRAETEIVRLLAERAPVGVTPESPLGAIPGATIGFAGAITGLLTEACASRRTAARTSNPVTMPAVATTRIYFLLAAGLLAAGLLGAGLLAAGGAGGGAGDCGGA